MQYNNVSSLSASCIRYRTAWFIVVLLLTISLTACSLSAGNPGINVQSQSPTPATHTSPAAGPKAAGTPTATFVPSTPTVVSTPTPPPGSNGWVVLQIAQRYETLIMQEQYRRAYNLLGAEEQQSEPYDAFIQDKNFVLYITCWRVDGYVLSQENASTWDVGILLAQLTCATGLPAACYDWHLRLRLVYGLPEIVWIELYPSATGDEC